MKRESKSALVFVGITFALSWAYEMGIIWPYQFALGAEPTQMQVAVRTTLIALVMFFPAIGALLTRLVLREGFAGSMLRPHLPSRWRTYLWAWFAPMLLTAAGCVVYYLCYPDRLGPCTVPAGQGPLMVLLVLVCPLLNAINTFGEEWGWRAYLLPKLMQAHGRFVPVTLLTGLIWGLWHAPIIAIGHNYGIVMGTASWLQVLGAIGAMCLVCIVLSFLENYATLRADSVWPAVIIHGTVNGTAGTGMLFLAAGTDVNLFVGPTNTGILGGSAMVAAALVIAIIAPRRLKK